MFRKIVLEVLIIKNFVVLQKVLQNSQHFIFMKSLFSGLNKDFLISKFSNISNNFYFITPFLHLLRHHLD